MSTLLTLLFARTAAGPIEGPPPQGGPRTRHRSDIDGLRAVAVLGVVLFHYGFAQPRGGFTGVDIFFVISGFLITAILEGELAQNRFSFAGFYERRVRRILPALLVMLLACDCLTTRWLPNDLRLTGLGLINAATFTSNIYFVSLAEDYFAAGTLATQPVLHTWSLGVEAQFYLVFPILWVTSRRWPVLRRTGFIVLALASFAFAAWGVVHWPEGSFYLLPARWWEFLTGGALVMLPRFTVARPARTAMAALGLGLIAAGFLAVSATTPFPGAAALLPCLGAGLVIQAGTLGPNPVSGLLGFRALTAVGRISYSLYLWHWPVLVFATYGRSTPLSSRERWGLLALTAVLSVGSWLFVERTVIERRWLASRRTLFLTCAAGLFGCAGLGLALNLAGQNKLRLASFPPAVLAFAHDKIDWVGTDCRPAGPDGPDCRFGAAGKAPSVVLWGNSFARMWMPGLDEAARRHGVAGLALLLTKCPPLEDIRFPAIRGCEAFNRDALAFILAHPELKTVILGGNWGVWAGDLPALGPMIERLAASGRRVVVLRSPPEIPFDTPRVLALAALRHTPAPQPLNEARQRESRAAQDALFATLQARIPFDLLDPFSVLCDGTACPLERNGHALYYDASHVTRSAARAASALFDPVWARASP